MQGWRANVDIQFLLYDGTLDKTSVAEISQISDYIISYVCKGTETSVQEKNRMKDVILNSSECTGDISDVKRISRHLLNEVIKNRVISKQETMCYIARLPLFSCSEVIENVSISGYKRIGTGSEYSTSFITKYANRKEYLDKSMHEYFDIIKNCTVRGSVIVIPNYVGANFDNLYPLTAAQARSLLIIYYPWFKKFSLGQKTDAQLLQIFNSFLISDMCPLSLKNACFRAKYISKHDIKEPVSTFYPSSTLVNEALRVDGDAEDIAFLTNMLPCRFDETRVGIAMEYDVGEHHDWSKQSYPVSVAFLM